MTGPRRTGRHMPVDRGWAWVIVFGQFMNLFFMVGTAKSIGILMEEFHTYFHVPMALAATVMSVCGIAYAVAAPICILLGQRFSARIVVMVGGFIGFVGMSVCYTMVSMVFVIVFFGIGFGVGNATVYGNGLVLLGQYFKERRSLANGLALAGSSIGQFAMPPLIQYMLETYSLGGTLLLLGGLYFHVTLFGALFRPFPFYKKHNSPTEENGKFIVPLNKKRQNGDGYESTNILDEENDVGCDDQNSLGREKELHALMASTGSIYLGSIDCLNELAQQPNASRVYRDDIPEETGTLKRFLRDMFDFSVLKSYICIFYTLVSFFGFFGQFNFVIFLPSYALSRGITKYNKAMLVSICGICDLVGRVLFGFIGDLQILQRYRIKSLCLIFLGMNTFMFAFSNTFAWIAVHSGIYGFFGGGFVGMIGVVLIDFVGIDLMPKYLAVVLLFQGIGAAAGQPLLGFIRDYTGSYVIVVYLCASCCIVGGTLLLFWPLVRKMETRRLGKTDTDTSPETKDIYMTREQGI